MPVNSLMPVAGVEQRALPQLSLATVVAERFDDERLHLVTDRDGINEHKPDLFSFRNKGGSRQRAADLRDFSFAFGRSWKGFGYVSSSIKSNIKLSGTYSMNGELYTGFEEKGIYIDQFS